jgi:5-methylthioadenosine/S-adenosylhomocysteine deaminase
MIRFYNGRILTFTDGINFTGDEVWIGDDGTISYVGKERTDAPKFQREINLCGNVLMPGFKDAHAHSAMTFLRSLADDMPLQPWLYEKVFPMENKLTPEYVYHLTKLAILEYLTSGITSCFDMYFHFEACCDAAIDTGFRLVLGEGITDFMPRVEVAEERYLKFKDYHPLISFILGFHSVYTNSKERLEYMAWLSNKYKAPVFSHNSETKTEMEECIDKYGYTPTELAESMGMYNYGGGGHHCVYLSDNDISIFKKRNLWVVTNPGSNSKLASGVAPLSKYMDMGLNLAIGTDGPASNNALDMFREMYLATVLQKLKLEDAAAGAPEKILHMAVWGGAHAMDIPECDSIVPGKQADLIVIDLDRPNMQPINNIVKNIVYSGSKENIKMTMVAGHILYEDGKFNLKDDPKEIYYEANKIIYEMTK